jgi:HAE1 family hydrophobic/amphiphilic exporter-1
MQQIEMPDGYRWDWGTNQKRAPRSSPAWGSAIFLAIALIYMLLASQFESFVHPLTILVSVPLSVVG